MEQLENIPSKEYTKELQEAYETYGSHEYLQRHALEEIQKDLMALEDVEAGIDQKETHCGRCGEEFSECCEEDYELAGLCEWCGHISWNAANGD